MQIVHDASIRFQFYGKTIRHWPKILWWFPRSQTDPLIAERKFLTEKSVFDLNLGEANLSIINILPRFPDKPNCIIKSFAKLPKAAKKITENHFIVRDFGAASAAGLPYSSVFNYHKILLNCSTLSVSHLTSIPFFRVWPRFKRWNYCRQTIKTHKPQNNATYMRFRNALLTSFGHSGICTLSTGLFYLVL